MTDGISSALAGQQYSLLQAQAPEPVQQTQIQPERYDSPLPPGRGADFKPLMNLATKVSDQMQSVMKSDVSVGAEAEAEFPELRAMAKMFQEVREFSLVEFQFDLIGKSLQLAESNVRQLYQQQG